MYDSAGNVHQTRHGCLTHIGTAQRIEFLSHHVSWLTPICHFLFCFLLIDLICLDTLVCAAIAIRTRRCWHGLRRGRAPCDSLSGENDNGHFNGTWQLKSTSTPTPSPTPTTHSYAYAHSISFSGAPSHSHASRQAASEPEADCR